jgi:hypothetical protein
VAPVPPTPLTLNQRALDAAVDHALRRVGTLRRVSADRATQLQGNREYIWVLHRVDVTTSMGLPAVHEILKKEVEAAGGKLLSRSATTLNVGVLQGDRPLVTHEIRLLVPVSPRARVAIIFDDAGGSVTDLEAIIALQRPVVVSVLPGLRYSKAVTERAHAAGLEVFLHLPLEPEDASLNLGPGGIRSEMPAEEIAATVRADLLDVPGAVGVNNHMGSKGTTDERVMRAVLGVIQERRLIFVDSMTSRRSIAGRLAREMDIPTGIRAVFLDNDDDPVAIRAQLVRLIALAKQRGAVIAIGHAQRQTAKVLLGMLEEFEGQGVELVPISTVVH